MALEEETVKGTVERGISVIQRKTGLASCRFLFVLMLTFLFGGCDWAEDPCTQHVGINGTEPFYYYTGDCGEGVTVANPEPPDVPYIIQFDNSLLNYGGVRPKS